MMQCIVVVDCHIISLQILFKIVIIRQQQSVRLLMNKPSNQLIFHLDDQEDHQKPDSQGHSKKADSKITKQEVENEKYNNRDLFSTSISERPTQSENTYKHHEGESNLIRISPIKMDQEEQDQEIIQYQPVRSQRKLKREHNVKLKIDKSARRSKQLLEVQDHAQCLAVDQQPQNIQSIQLSRSEISSPLSSKRKLLSENHKNSQGLEEQQNSDHQYENNSPQIEELSQDQSDQEEGTNQVLSKKYYLSEGKTSTKKQNQQKIQILGNSLHQLAIQSIFQGKAVKCYVKVNNHGFFSLETQFQLYLISDKMLMLTATKKSYQIACSNFEIKSFTKKPQKADDLIATVKSNFTRTEYVLYDKKYSYKLEEIRQNGRNGESNTIIYKPQQIQRQIEKVQDFQKAYLSFKENMFGFKQQEVFILRRKKLNISKTDRFSDLNNAYQNAEMERVEVFHTKSAQINKEGHLTLDFKNDQLIASSKNMMIENELGDIGLLFGKIKDNLYVLDVFSPFSLLEGFFFALCLLDKKPFAQ